MIDHLFVYGTLMPSEPAWPVLAPHVADHRDARVIAVLWDTGYGFPGLGVPDGAAGSVQASAGAPTAVPGTLVRLHHDRLEYSLGSLDDYEGLGPHRYRRVAVRTECGTDCWTYEWVGTRDGFTELSVGWAEWVASGSASTR